MRAIMDFDPLVFRDMQDVAEFVGGDLMVTRDGQVVVKLVGDNAAAFAVKANNEPGLFPHGYLMAGSEQPMGLGPLNLVIFKF